jgi:hypothetical protein
MSTKIAVEEISRFLASGTPEVLCITGAWGVGKTFSWKRFLSQARIAEAIEFDRYSYVSLFGQNTIEDLRYAIFENTVAIDQIEAGPSPDSLGSALHLGEKWGRRLLQVMNLTSGGRAALTGGGRMLFLAVRNQIICFDDLERAGGGLKTKDVLGMISFLREERGCKIVLLLNDEQLEGDDAEAFKTQLEKVIDTRIAFDPTPEEAVGIGLTDDAVFRPWLREDAIKLGITNIRVIRKIQRSAARLQELLTDFDPDVLRAAVHTLTLVEWSHLRAERAPPLDYIKTFNPFTYLVNEDLPEAPVDKVSRQLLGAYGFDSVDDLDRVIIAGIENGYFDADALREAAKVTEGQIFFQRQDNSFTAAWDLYHGSFKQNADEVLNNMTAAFQSSVQTISPLNLNGTVALFKDLGREAQAKELIAYYVTHHPGDQRFFILRHSAFGQEIKDPDVRAAFAAKAASFAVEFDPNETLRRIAETNAWTDQDVANLAMLTPQDFRAVFEVQEGPLLRDVVQAALHFGDLGAAQQEMVKIAENARTALRAIAATSPLNARRVRLYGIEENPEVD